LIRLIEVFIKTLDLLEAEGRLLRGNVIRVAAVLVTAMIIGFLTLVGVLLLILSLFLKLESAYGPVIATLVGGLTCLLIATIGGLGVRLWMDNKTSQ